MRGASNVLQSYTAACRASFAQLKAAYGSSARAQQKAHQLLTKTWTSVVSLLGNMASQIQDGGLFTKLVLQDLEAMRGTILQSMTPRESLAFCANATTGLLILQDRLGHALTSGFSGQTQRQLATLFWELVMLQDRYEWSGMGHPPDLEAGHL